jgi:hypothetical protein
VPSGASPWWAVMVSSAFTGFCLVHYGVQKAMPDPGDR